MSEFKNGKFMTWFEAQFGKRPQSLELFQVEEIERKALKERYLWRVRNEWEAQKDAAMKAWNVHTCFGNKK